MNVWILASAALGLFNNRPHLIKNNSKDSDMGVQDYVFLPILYCLLVKESRITMNVCMNSSILLVARQTAGDWDCTCIIIVCVLGWVFVVIFAMWFLFISYQILPNQKASYIVGAALYILNKRVRYRVWGRGDKESVGLRWLEVENSSLFHIHLFGGSSEMHHWVSVL